MGRQEGYTVKMKMIDILLIIIIALFLIPYTLADCKEIKENTECEICFPTQYNYKPTVPLQCDYNITDDKDTTQISGTMTQKGFKTCTNNTDTLTPNDYTLYVNCSINQIQASDTYQFKVRNLTTYQFINQTNQTAATANATATINYTQIDEMLNDSHGEGNWITYSGANITVNATATVNYTKIDETLNASHGSGSWVTDESTTGLGIVIVALIGLFIYLSFSSITASKITEELWNIGKKFFLLFAFAVGTGGLWLMYLAAENTGASTNTLNVILGVFQASMWSGVLVSVILIVVFITEVFDLIKIKKQKKENEW